MRPAEVRHDGRISVEVARAGLELFEVDEEGLDRLDHAVLRALIRKFGGDMKETYGVPVEEIQEAIKHGVRKINIDTDIRLAMTGAVRKFLAENPDKFDAREWLKPAREAAKQICKQRYLEFGCQGQAPKIKSLPLQVVAQKYQKGELAQVVT